MMGGGEQVGISASREADSLSTDDSALSSLADDAVELAHARLLGAAKAQGADCGRSARRRGRRLQCVVSLSLHLLLEARRSEGQTLAGAGEEGALRGSAGGGDSGRGGGVSHVCCTCWPACRSLGCCCRNIGF